jgi:phage repressor protein C with HTH and peptisase S24 domain
MNDNQMANIRRTRLRDWMDAKHVNGTSLAQRLGTTRAYVSGLFNTEKHFGEKAARSIEKKLVLPTGYLDAQAPAMAPVDVWEDPADLPDGVYALVPRIGIKLSAGSGMEAVEETELPPLAFRESWLKKKHVTSRKHLRILEVDGPSMEPLLMDGDVVLVDLGQHDIIDNEVYAIAYGSELRIKRLSKRFDGGLLIRSDNQRYPDEAISPAESQHIRVLGRMIWRGG